MNDFIDQCSIPFILVHLRPSYDVGNVHLLPISQYLLFSSRAHGRAQIELLGSINVCSRTSSTICFNLLYHWPKFNQTSQECSSKIA